MEASREAISLASCSDTQAYNEVAILNSCKFWIIVRSSPQKKRKSVVLLEYPRKGIWAVGFATKENKGEINNLTKKGIVNVFVPTTPNPTSGFLLMFPKNEVIYLDLSFEEASKFIVSAGSTNP